ncbi:glycosyltransferase [Mycoplasmopsis adleri]|uniref:glycosyltransferase n=1 Tax=Mycoplasmopsis adleri TaxID=51362 RepID=UPI003873B6AA
MQLSIIVPNIVNNKNLTATLDTFKNQDNQDFELILVLTNTNKTMYSTIEKYLKFFGTRLKFITNSTRKSIQNDIISAFHLVKGQYTYVFFSDNADKHYYVSRLLQAAQKYDVDVVEFRPRLVNSIRWKPDPRLTCDMIYKQDKNPEYIAYAYPFIFNKIFKSTLVHQFVKYKQKELNDTKFAVQLTYMLLIKSQSYVYINERIVRENISSNIWLTPSNFIGQFADTISFLKSNNIKLTEEINYASFYFLQIFLGGLLKTWRKRFSLQIFADQANYNEMRSKKYTEDLYKYLKQQHEENHLFFDTNIYMIKNNNEVSLIKNLPEINKWNDILGEL